MAAIQFDKAKIAANKGAGTKFHIS